MSSEVMLNIELFRTNVEKLKFSVESLETNFRNEASFSHTNVNPFKEDLQNIMKAMTLLEKYKEVLMADIQSLKETGESIRENDEHVAKKLNIQQPLQH